MAASALDSTALRRQLRNELRKARNGAGLTQREIADRLEWSTSKVIRIETGQVAVSTVDLRAMLREYGIHDMGRIEQLVELARSSKKQSWSQYRGTLSQAAMDYFGYEASAYIVRQFESLLVPGLLQTDDYSREVLQRAFPTDESSFERRFEARKVRQELLERSDRPQLFFVLDEAVVRRSVGGRDVMLRQIDHLIELSERERVSIQIYPFSAGAYPGMGGPFTQLELPGDEGDVLYFEARTESVVRDTEDDRADVVRYLEMFQTFENEATDHSEFLRILEDVKQHL